MAVKSRMGVVDWALENVELVAPPTCMEIFANNQTAQKAYFETYKVVSVNLMEIYLTL